MISLSVNEFYTVVPKQKTKVDQYSLLNFQDQLFFVAIPIMVFVQENLAQEHRK